MRVQRKVGGKFHLKLNISKRPIANKYREGKMKRTLKREGKVLEIARRKAVGPNTCDLTEASQHQFAPGELAAESLTRGSALEPTEGKCLRMLRKWIPPTRLETRTKESNIYASARAENPCAN